MVWGPFNDFGLTGEASEYTSHCVVTPPINGRMVAPASCQG